MAKIHVSQEAHEQVRQAIRVYAAACEDSERNVLGFLSRRASLEIAAQVAGLSVEEGAGVPKSTLEALHDILCECKLAVPPMFVHFAGRRRST